MEDYQIIALYNARNSIAIQETSKKYGRLCYKVADGILHCKEDNEECVNDTYLTAWNTIPPENPNYLSSYLCRITRNLSLKKYEKEHAKKRNKNFLVSLSELEDILIDSGDILQEIEDREFGEIINRFLWALPLEERNMFIRRYFLFHPIKHIASDLSFSQSKVKSALARTRKRLGKYCKDYLEGDKNE